MENNITKQQVVDELITNPIYEEILDKYFPTPSDTKNEFRQFLWLQLLELKDGKLIDAYTKKYLTYLYVSIIRNSIISDPVRSRWLKEQEKRKDFKFIQEDDDDVQLNYDEMSFDDEIQNDKKIKLQIIDEALAYELNRNPRFKVSFDCFNYYYKDRMTLRAIQAKTRIQYSSVRLYIQEAEIVIKRYMIKNNTKLTKVI